MARRVLVGIVDAGAMEVGAPGLAHSVMRACERSHRSLVDVVSKVANTVQREEIATHLERGGNVVSARTTLLGEAMGSRGIAKLAPVVSEALHMGRCIVRTILGGDTRPVNQFTQEIEAELKEDPRMIAKPKSVPRL